MVAVAERCPKLRELTFECCQVADAALGAVAEHCRALRVLCFSQRSGCLAALYTLAAIAVGCPLLEDVTIQSPVLSDSVVKVLAVCCPQLRRLSLRAAESGSYIGAGALLTVAKNCPGLEELNVDDTAVTDAVLDALAAGCPTLARLDFYGGPSLTVDGVRRFVAGCPALRSLFLSHTGFPPEVRALLEEEPRPGPSPPRVSVVLRH
jgi:hypothetical protein